MANKERIVRSQSLGQHFENRCSAVGRILTGLSAILVIGALLAPASQAGDVPVFIQYVGTGLDTATDINSDTVRMSIVQAHSKGTFGPSTTAIVSEFVPAMGNCVSEDAVYFDLLHSTAVTTFRNHSQLYYFVQSGWICIDLVTGQYEGEVSGIFAGGTGRFATASGGFVSPFRGQNLTDTDIGFRSIQGAVNGTLSLR